MTYKLPAKVDLSFREAARCESVEAWLATAVMVRRTLEAVGQQFDPKVKSPATALKVLKEQGVISDELFAWGDALRFLGNIGAHPSDDMVSREDAKDAVDFLVAILETIYHLRPKFQSMLKRRAKDAAEGAPMSAGDGEPSKKD